MTADLAAAVLAYLRPNLRDAGSKADARAAMLAAADVELETFGAGIASVLPVELLGLWMRETHGQDVWRRWDLAAWKATEGLR